MTPSRRRLTPLTINREIAFTASRYDKGDAAYVNCPFTKDEYEAFYEALLHAELAPLAEHETKTSYFEGCLPIEVMAARGPKTLSFGPMKPVGLNDPRTGRRPWACLQLRQENRAATLYSMVGFQTRMKWGEQKRVFRMIPGLENAEFVRYGVIHRNTYIQSPLVFNGHAPDEVVPERLFRRPDHRRGGLRRVGGVRYPGGPQRRPALSRTAPADAAGHDHAGGIDRLRRPLRRQGLPADELQLGHRAAAPGPHPGQEREGALLAERALAALAEALPA